MYLHFKTVADAVSIPCILYNVPGRTGCAISENNVCRLARHPNIVGIKEASGDIGYAARIARHLSDDFVMYSGNDDMILSMMSLGCSGVISVLANVMPKETHEMIFDYLNGEPEKTRAAQLKYLELVNALFAEVNPIPVKEALNMMGMEVGGYRLPLTAPSAVTKERLQKAMKEAGLL